MPGLARFAALLAVASLPGCAAPVLLEDFRTPAAACYDRDRQPQTSIVDTHLHFRPFGGAAIPFDEVIGYLRRTGVRFVNVYGIGQTLPADSPCTYYLDCLGTPVTPSLKNDIVNAASTIDFPPKGVHVTLSMTFPDLARPETLLPTLEILDAEYPGLFAWAGEINLVKQAQFDNGHKPLEPDAIARWTPFMEVLRDRGIPLAVHSDLGSDEEPTKYLRLMQEVLESYPDNTIVWVHMGLSLQQTDMDPARHVRILESMLDAHPNLMLDISWRVLEDHYFARADRREIYVAFFNQHSERILPGTDFLASRNKDFDVYKAELEATSRINRYLSDTAFRNIALGENYFRLLGLDYAAPPVCARDES